MTRKPRISYREWLDRRPTPAAGERAQAAPVPAPVEEPAAPAVVAPPAPEAAVEPLPAPAAAVAPPGADGETSETAYLVFRVGRESFALPLEAVEEAVDIESIQRVPEMGPAMLGVLSLRGALVPLYASAAVLGAEATTRRAALVFVTPRGRLALAVDDVDDVLPLAEGTLQQAPLDFGDSLLLGVARRGTELIGVLDADALIAACRAEPALETA
jgi:purine-binding chemotaxis protein CheW